MTDFNNMAQVEREAIIDRIRSSDDDPIHLIRDDLPPSTTVIWSSEKLLQQVDVTPSIIYAIALG